MRRRPSKRVLVVHALALTLALGLWLYSVSRSAGQDDGLALAAPPPPASTADAGLPQEAEITDAGALVDGAPDEGAAHADSPIDLAIAPDGGVPYHPSAQQYRSPFANPSSSRGVPIKTAVLLNSIDDYDVKTGTFTADFFLSLTSARPMPDLKLTSPNGKLESVEMIADKPTFKLLRINGAFKSPPDLRRYPFDSQALRISLEDDTRGTDQMRFVVDKERTQLGRGFRALGWRIDYVEARSLSHSYPDRFEGDDLYYSGYIFTVGLERYATSAAFKVFVPAFVIVLIALLGLWVPPNEMEVRSNSGAPMLAGAVLFHFALMQELPATSYLTRADKLMMGVYITLALVMLSTWFMFLVRPEKMMAVFRIARLTVPILSVLAMAYGCLG